MAPRWLSRTHGWRRGPGQRGRTEGFPHPASSRPGTPPAARLNGTSTTAPSRTWSPSPSNLQLARSRVESDPTARSRSSTAPAPNWNRPLAELRRNWPVASTPPCFRPRPGCRLPPRDPRSAAGRVGEMPDDRLPEPVEAAAYYVVARSLTNVARYSERQAGPRSTPGKTGWSASGSPTTASAE